MNLEITVFYQGARNYALRILFTDFFIFSKDIYLRDTFSRIVQSREIMRFYNLVYFSLPSTAIWKSKIKS